MIFATVWSLAIRFNTTKNGEEIFRFIGALTYKCQSSVGYGVYVGNLLYDDDLGVRLTVKTYKEEDANNVRNYLQDNDEVVSYDLQKVESNSWPLLKMIGIVTLGLCLSYYILRISSLPPAF